MKKKNAFTKLYIALFIAILVVPTAVWLFIAFLFPETYAELNGKLNENRSKQEFSLENLSDYVNDHAPFRDSVILLYQKADGRLDAVYQAAAGKIGSLTHANRSDGSAPVSNLDAFFGNNEKENASTVSIPAGNEEGEIKETIPEHVHAYELKEEVLPDCENEGYRVYECACGDSYVETIEALGHEGTLVAESESSFTTYGYKEYICSVCNKTYRTDIVDKQIDTSYLAPRVLGQGALLGRENWLFYTGNNSVSFYKGSNLLDDETLKLYADKLTYLNGLCEEKGIKLYVMFMPNKEQVYDEYMPSYDIEDTYKRTARLTDYLNENTDVPVVYPLKELNAYDFYWQTYYKYDTHWNHAGAFIGLMELYKAMGMEAADPVTVPGSYKKAELDGTIDLGGLSRDRYNGDTEFIFDYKPEITVNGLNDNNVCRMTSDSPNEQKLVLLSDSFRIMMLPYISKDFSDVTAAHRDYAGSVKKDILSCDILVLAAVERYDYRVFGKSMDSVIDFLGGSFEEQ